MKTMIDGYKIFPGDHCGSVAMRGLLHHYCGLDLPESAVFGLGSGAASVYLSGPGLDPSAMLFGRTASMEQDLATNLDIDYRERPEVDNEEAWQIVREEVLAGRPTMLSGDILYLDYREFKVHFPGHRFVLLGFDDETQKAFIADRIRPEPEACSYGALITSRNPPEGMSTHNLWGRFHDTNVGRELVDAAKLAISRCAKAMLVDPLDADQSAQGIATPARGQLSAGAPRAELDRTRRGRQRRRWWWWRRLALLAAPAGRGSADANEQDETGATHWWAQSSGVVGPGKLAVVSAGERSPPLRPGPARCPTR